MASRRAWTDPVVETSDPLRLACPTLSRQGRAVGIALPSALPQPSPPAPPGKRLNPCHPQLVRLHPVASMEVPHHAERSEPLGASPRSPGSRPCRRIEDVPGGSKLHVLEIPRRRRGPWPFPGPPLHRQRPSRSARRAASAAGVFETARVASICAAMDGGIPAYSQAERNGSPEAGRLGVRHRTPVEASGDVEKLPCWIFECPANEVVFFPRRPKVHRLPRYRSPEVLGGEDPDGAGRPPKEKLSRGVIRSTYPPRSHYIPQHVKRRFQGPPLHLTPSRQRQCAGTAG